MISSEQYWKLLQNIQDNRLSCREFSNRLLRRFHHRIVVQGNGQPGHIRGYHRGPYWCIVVPDPTLPRRELPREILNECRALTSQGVRYRKEFLTMTYVENADQSDLLGFLFPLNLQDL